MKKKELFDIFCILIFFMLILAVHGSAKAFAIGETSRADYMIMPGVSESMVYVTVDSGYNVRTHILRISSNADVILKASYGGYYRDSKTAEERKWHAKNWDDDNWTFESVRDQADDYYKSLDAKGEVIVASNGDFFDIKTGEPEGSLVIEENILLRNGKRPIFAVLKNGKAVIRKKGNKLNNISEAISGREMLIWRDRIVANTGGERDPREAIGICSDGTIVIISVDGREPASAGVTLYELAEIMKAQGCRDALNLDGGGSASLMTKRYNDSELVFRSNHSDGPERNVGSALLVVTKSSKKTEFTDANNTVNMKSRETQLKRDSSGIYHYKNKGIGQTGFFSINGESYLFLKGKGMTAKIKIDKTTYYFKSGKLKSVTDKKAGDVIIGYCGSIEKGKNLIYAYHAGDKCLNIGINPFSKETNGKMKEWSLSTVKNIPWYAVRAEIRKVYIADGVANVGGYFLYSTKGTMIGGAAAPKCRLSHIRLPLSLQAIGAYALYNKPSLTDVVIPAKVTKIGKEAFAYSGHGSIIFRTKSAPAFGKNSLKKTSFCMAYVKKSKAWKKFVKQKRFRKYGYKKTIKYK